MGLEKGWGSFWSILRRCVVLHLMENTIPNRAIFIAPDLE